MDPDACTGCGDCAEICPVERPSEYDMSLVNRKAVYKPYAQAIPGGFAIEKLDKAPCRMACPAHLNVQGYVQMVKQGKYREAVEIIMRDLPFPGVLGRICPHRCEKSCRRLEVDAAVSIRELKRVAADHVDLKELPIPDITPKAEKVAIIGAGPAGLTAAYFLALEGYPVSVYEAMPEAGGMMRYAIPEFRLPRKVLDAEIDNLKRFGIEIHTNTRLGTDVTIEELQEHGAKAVFLGTGAWKGLKTNIPGEGHPEGVLHVTRFLREVWMGDRTKVQGRVVVLGAGHSGMDAARVAIRLGAERVNLVEPFSENEMAAEPEEKQVTEEEGARIHFQALPKRVVIENDQVVGIECLRTRLTDPDTTGRRKFIPIEDTDFFMEADLVISSIGQEPDLEYLAPDSGVEVSKWNHIVVNPETLQTNEPGIFAGGDVITGSATVIEAVEAGKRAAGYMAMYLKGESLPTEWQEEPPIGENWVDIPEDEPARNRLQVPTLPPEKAVSGFEEFALGVDEAAAGEEASRCLNCGGCCECYQCVGACKAEAVTLNTHAQQPETVVLDVGSVILAPGFEAFDPSGMEVYGYAEYGNVVTSMEFERILSATGPYQGHLMRPSDGKAPQRIAWLQCVGSRDQNQCDNRYCSSVCCMYATKEAVI
ncbi:MAG: FAD-dependent oxidoreductase, partial [Desulfatiglandaceae bacterium]